MNQEKIGNFINEQRKEKKLTQEQLAEMLSVSKNAVSKWERGLNLPDVSLMKDLCDILNISLNELFAGEKFMQEVSHEKTNESIVNAIKYTSDKAKNKMVKIKFVFFAIVILMSIFVIMFSIDMGRMIKNKPVVFSTWGFKYSPAINLEEEKMKLAIKDFLYSKDYSEEKHEDQKTFVSMRVYLIEDNDDTSYLYAWVLSEKYFNDAGQVKIDSGYSIPHKFTLKKNNSGYEVISYVIPQDGSRYSSDMKKIFPSSVLKEMELAHDDGTIKRLQLDIEEQVKLYFHD